MWIYLLYIITALLLGIVLVVLQIFFSKRQKAWLGMILPVISFGLSIVLTLTTPYWVKYDWWVMPLTLIVTNVPTAIFVSIYIYCRKGKQRMNEISKMSIQDLE